MKNVKKMVALMLTMSMTATLFTGCGSADSGSASGGGSTTTNESGIPEVDLTLAIWGVDTAVSDPNDPILEIIKEKTGVTIVPQNITWDDATEKTKLWAVAGELPDVFAGDFVGSSFYFDWIDQGVLQPLPDDLSAYPNLEDYLSNMEKAQAAMVDGKYYMIPRQTYEDVTWTVSDRNIAYRWDLAQAAGITEEPENWDEFREMITAIIATDSEGKGITGLTALQPTILASYIFQYGGIFNGKWIAQDGEYMHGYFAGDLLAVMQLGRDMYQDGTIEPDIILQKMDTAQDKFLQGKSAAILYATGAEEIYNYAGSSWEELYGHSILEDIKIAKIYPSSDGNSYYCLGTEAWSETYISSNATAEEVDAICRLLDFYYSEEGRNLMIGGIEGEDYDMVDGRMVMKEGVSLPDKYSFFNNNSLPSLGIWNPSIYDLSYPSTKPDEFRQLTQERHQDALDNGTLPEYNDAISLLYTPLKASFIISPEDDFFEIISDTRPVEEMVAELMADYEAAGLSEMIEEVNAAAVEAGIPMP